MSQLGDAMGRMFGGTRASFREELAALKREHGTVTALARALGVDRRTIQRWDSGKIHTPRPATAEKVHRGYRDVVSRGRGRSDRDVTVSFTQQGRHGRQRQRQVTGDRLDLAPGTMRAAREAFVTAGPEAAAAAFVKGIGDDWYHDLFEEDLTGEGEEPDDAVSDPSPTGVSVS